MPTQLFRTHDEYVRPDVSHGGMMAHSGGSFSKHLPLPPIPSPSPKDHVPADAMTQEDNAVRSLCYAESVS